MMKRNIVNVVLLFLACQVVQAQQSKEFDALFQLARNCSAAGICAKECIFNHSRMERQVSITGIGYKFNPNGDGATTFNPDSLSAADRYFYDQYKASRDLQHTIISVVENARAVSRECYWWEKHQDGKDSMYVSLVYNDSTGNGKYTKSQYRDGHTSYKGGETTEYIYYSFPTPIKIRASMTRDSWFSLTHSYLADTCSSRKLPLDYKAYESEILPLLRESNVTHRPITWIHDEEFSPDSADIRNVYQSVMSVDGQFAGSTTGTIFTLRANGDEETKSVKHILKKIMDKTDHYLMTHTEQKFTYNRYPSLDDLGTAGIFLVESDDEDSGKSYEVYINKEGDNYYLLLLHVEGLLWMPQHYSTLKSLYNNKEIFIEAEGM